MLPRCSLLAGNLLRWRVRPKRCVQACWPSHDQHVAWRSRFERVHPCSDWETISFYAHRGGTCSVDEHLAQVDVTSLADAQQLGLATGRVLPWHETEPCGEVSSLTERRAVADGGDDS